MAVSKQVMDGEVHNHGAVTRFALWMTERTERYMPDAFIFAILATILVIVAAFIVDPHVRSHPLTLASAWGNGFWTLLTFTMQASLTIIGGYALATAPPVLRIIQKIAGLPKSPRSGVATVALVAMLTGWFNWAFSLIFSAVLAKEIAKKIPRTDYRALGAVSFLALGTVWAQGISSSASLAVATNGSMPAKLVQIMGGLIPLNQTIFLWQSIVSVIVEIAIVTFIAWHFTPDEKHAKTASDMNIDLSNDFTPVPKDGARTPSEKIEYSPVLTIIIVVLSLAYLIAHFTGPKGGLNALDLNTVNFIFLIGAFLLHWRPVQFMKAIKEATPAAWGVILQFPFYAGIFGLITGTALSSDIAQAFVHISNHYTFPVFTTLYSMILGIFVPSGGSKWIIEAPYVMQAAQHLHVHLGWTVSLYNLGEALANLMQPFWMLPILGVLGLRSRDVMGFTFIVAVFLVPVVLLMGFLFNLTL